MLSSLVSPLLGVVRSYRIREARATVTVPRDTTPTTIIDGVRLILLQGDITDQEVDAIVNAANTTLLGGGGVDGAIHRRGGPAILAECRRIRDRDGGCPTGKAVITGAGKLPARHVIHTVGPVWSGGQRGEETLLRSAYRSSLERAREHRLATIAFPSISTGAYGYPIDEASRIALDEVATAISSHALHREGLEEVRFVLFSSADRETYQRALEGVDSARSS